MQYLAVSTWTMYSSHSASNSIHRYFWCLVKLALVVMPMYYWNKAKAATLQLSHLPQFCIVYRWMIEALVTLYNRSPKLPKISPTAQKTNKYTCRGTFHVVIDHTTPRDFSLQQTPSLGGHLRHAQCRFLASVAAVGTSGATIPIFVQTDLLSGATSDHLEIVPP